MGSDTPAVLASRAGGLFSTSIQLVNDQFYLLALTPLVLTVKKIFDFVQNAFTYKKGMN